jgi:hypothetical protein
LPPPRVVVLADDLMWSTRLVAHLRAAGADPVPVQTIDALRRELPASHGVVIDLTALRYDGIEAISIASEGGRRTIAVGQHDDVEQRKRAMAAGAERVYAYRKLFEDGPRTLGSWLTLAESGR